VSTWAASSIAIWNQVATSINNSWDHELERGGSSIILGGSIAVGVLTDCLIASPSWVQNDVEEEEEEDREGLRELLLSHVNRACIKREVASPSEPHTRNGNCQ
jgi:hypothetical protein